MKVIIHWKYRIENDFISFQVIKITFFSATDLAQSINFGKNMQKKLPQFFFRKQADDFDEYYFSFGCVHESFFSLELYNRKSLHFISTSKN